MITDTLSTKSNALPAANASANGTAIDLSAVNPGNSAALQVELRVEATSTLVDTKTITLKVQHSADNASWSDMPGGSGGFVVTGVSGNGSAAFNKRLRLSDDVLRYIRAVASVESGGGDNTAKNFTLALCA